MTVTVLLVSHDGMRWLPSVLGGLQEQTRKPDRWLAVDTGSTDGSGDLLAEHLGAGAVLDAPAHSSYADAVSAGLERLSPARPDDWVWLLHDDSRPAPDALERLLDAADVHPSADILGPKLREWPSLRRLVEVGVSISGTGRRETGLERGEYDQGQHDATRDVLAVSTAGMLVRRSVLDRLDGLDRRLPLFGNDIDFGWRAARAGHRTVVVPDAVVFHAEAAHRGVRDAAGTASTVRREERRAALYTLLVNCALLVLPVQLVRLLLGSLVRALGLLLVRAPREAYDELVALATTYARPDRVVAGRVERRRSQTVPARDIRRLLPPVWMPYRHGLDFVSDIAVALVLSAGDASAARRSARRRAAETGPVPVEAESLPEDTGLVARLLVNPTAWVFSALLLLALVGLRGVVGGGFLSGGALLPAPDSATSWWRLYLESWHDLGVGSPAGPAPFVLPLAAAGSLLLGEAWLLVDLLMLMAVPLAAAGAYRMLRLVTTSRWAALWGAVAYGLLPVLTGAVDQGRIGTVVGALVLPWLVKAAWHLSAGASMDRRWRAAWRTALLLALLTAFVPAAWFLALALAAVVLVRARLARDDRWTGLAGWGPVAVAVGAVPALLLPWLVAALLGGTGATGPFAEAGLPAPELLDPVTAWDLLLGRPAEMGAAPGWLSATVVLAAVAALLRRDTRRTVLGCWVVVVLALAAALLQVSGGLWSGFFLLLAHGAAVAAAAVAGSGILDLLTGRSFGWRQPLGLVITGLAVIAPIAGALWWVATGVSGPLDRQPPSAVPAYMTDAASADPASGVLLVDGSTDGGFEYVVHRGDGQRLGDETALPAPEDQAGLTTLVSNLATAPVPEDVTRLARHGIAFVYAPPPVDDTLAGNLDTVSGMTAASTVNPQARAWQVEAEPSRTALPEPGLTLRPLWLGLQGVTLVLALVFAAPTRKVRR